MYYVICSLFAAGLLPFAVVSVLFAATGSVHSFLLRSIFWSALCHHLHDPSWWYAALLFSSFVSIFRALCRPLHGPSCSLEPPVLFYDFDSTSTHFFLNSTCVSYRSPRHLYAPNLPLLHYPSTKAFVTPRATSPYMHPDSDRPVSYTHLTLPTNREV